MDGRVEVIEISPRDQEAWAASEAGLAEQRYIEYLKEIEAQEEVARQRRGKDRPYRWGEKLNEKEYFCASCWDNGLGDGAHPYDVPPCDPIRR